MRLETARLLLRPCTADDLDALHRLWTDADVRRYLFDDRIIPREQAAAMIQDSLASFPTHGFGLWLVHRAGEGAMIGFSGLSLTGDPPEVELLYGITPSAWGQGVATEAARAVLRYGFAELRLARITAGAGGAKGAPWSRVGKDGGALTRRGATPEGGW